MKEDCFDVAIEKQCTRCNAVKPIAEFRRVRKGSEKRRSVCNVCQVDSNRLYAAKNAEKIRAYHAEYRKANPEKHREAVRRYREADIERAREQTRRSVAKHRESDRSAYNQYMREYRDKNKDALTSWEREYRAANRDRQRENNRKRYLKDPSRFIHKESKRRCLMSLACWSDQSAIKGIYKQASDLRKSGFDCHVDHVDPLKGAMSIDGRYVQVVCGLHVESNLQILPGSLNLRKGNRFTPYRIDGKGTQYFLVNDEWEESKCVR